MASGHQAVCDKAFTCSLVSGTGNVGDESVPTTGDLSIDVAAQSLSVYHCHEHHSRQLSNTADGPL